MSGPSRKLDAPVQIPQPPQFLSPAQHAAEPPHSRLPPDQPPYNGPSAHGGSGPSPQGGPPGYGPPKPNGMMYNGAQNAAPTSRPDSARQDSVRQDSVRQNLKRTTIDTPVNARRLPYREDMRAKRRKMGGLAFNPDEVLKLDGCLCRGFPSQQALARLAEAPLKVLCTACAAPFHSCCVQVDPQPAAVRAFVCPRCRVSDLDPFYPSLSALHVLPLWDDHTVSAQVVATRSLPLKSPNIQDLRRKGAEVFLFCMKLKCGAYNKLHEWPQTIQLKVNGNVEKVGKPEYEHKRRDVPIRVTPYLLQDVQNNIEVTATNFEVKGQVPDAYFIALCLCERRTSEQIMKALVTTSRLPFEEATRRAMTTIQRFFGKSNAPQDDDEVDMLDTSCKLKLVCPITLTRIQVPVRGRACLHFQCYDLMSFLEVTKSTKAFCNRWKCVECNAFVRPRELIIDSFVEHILQTASENTEAVVFAEDGSWEEHLSAVPLGGEVGSDDEGNLSDVEPGNNAAIDLVELSDSDDDDDDELGVVEAAKTANKTTSEVSSLATGKATGEPGSESSSEAVDAAKSADGPTASEGAAASPTAGSPEEGEEVDRKKSVTASPVAAAEDARRRNQNKSARARPKPRKPLTGGRHPPPTIVTARVSPTGRPFASPTVLAAPSAGQTGGQTGGQSAGQTGGQSAGQSAGQPANFRWGSVGGGPVGGGPVGINSPTVLPLPAPMSGSAQSWQAPLPPARASMNSQPGPPFSAGLPPYRHSEQAHNKWPAQRAAPIAIEFKAGAKSNLGAPPPYATFSQPTSRQSLPQGMPSHPMPQAMPPQAMPQASMPPQAGMPQAMPPQSQPQAMPQQSQPQMMSAQGRFSMPQGVPAPSYGSYYAAPSLPGGDNTRWPTQPPQAWPTPRATSAPRAPWR